MVKDLNAPAEKNQTAVAQKTSQLLALTNRSEGLTSGNLNASVMMINQLAGLKSGSTDSPNEKEIKSFVQATSNVLQPNNSKSWKELEAVNKTFATSILSSVEVYGRSLSMPNVSLSKCNKEEEDNLVFEAWSLEKSKRSLQLEFPNCSGWDDNKISISMDTLNSSISSERFHQPTRVWATYYPTIHNFLPGNKDLGSISSKVLSLSIDGLDANEKLTRPVLITLRHNQEESMNIRRTCAFWNVKRNDWDSTGCFVISTTLNYTICSCDHLTNFAILMSISDASMTTHASDYKALSIISIIGCSISVVALILTIIVYALTWKQSKSAQATVLINLCVALIIAYFVFMAGANRVESKHGCTAVAVLLHYFFLAAFFIMLAEGVELLLYIIFVFHVRTTIETAMLITSAWVLPLIIVSVSLGFTERKGYGNYDSDGNGQACWLSTENGLIWAFVGPVLCIITVNIIILAIVLRWMSKRRPFLANNEKKRNEIRATLWNMAVTCPVLGLGWLFGIFFLISDHVFFQYLFVIANSVQGLLIFIFHALFHNKTAKEKISYVCSNYICGWRKTVSDDSSKRSSTQEPAKKTEKTGFVPVEVHDNRGMEKGDILLGTGTLTTSIGDSSTLESTRM